jgi:hypothetical protein
MKLEAANGKMDAGVAAKVSPLRRPESPQAAKDTPRHRLRRVFLHPASRRSQRRLTPFFHRLLGCSVFALFAAASIAAQEKAAPEAAPEPVPPPEGSIIINLPSAEVSSPATLTLLFAHRFSQPVQDSDIHTLFSFDSVADVKIGLAYSPLRNLEISLERDPAHCFCGLGGAVTSATQGLEIYQLGAKYRLLSGGPLSFALRLGGDWRTARGLDNRTTFFAQAIAGVSIGPRIRITAIPTYVSRTSGQPRFPVATYTDVFNVAGALSVALTRSINLHGEVLPRVARGGARGVGWIASLEKTVLRHRFAFTVGNLRATTVDQYVASDFRQTRAIPNFAPQDLYLGFNIVRLWKL